MDIVKVWRRSLIKLTSVNHGQHVTSHEKDPVKEGFDKQNNNTQRTSANKAARKHRRKTQRADLPPPPPPPVQDPNASLTSPENVQTKRPAEEEDSHTGTSQDIYCSTNEIADTSKTKPKPPTPIKPSGFASPRSSPEPRAELRKDSSPDLQRKVAERSRLGDNSDADRDGDCSNSGKVTKVPLSSKSPPARVPKPSPRHSLVLEKSPEAKRSPQSHPVPPPRLGTNMDIKPRSGLTGESKSAASQGGRPGLKPTPPPQGNKPKFVSNAKLKEAFLEKYGNGSPNKNPNQSSAVARSISALNSASSSKGKQFGSPSARVESLNKGAIMRDKRESTASNLSSSSIRSKRETTVFQSGLSSSSPVQRHKLSAAAPSEADMRASLKQDKVVIADFLEQLKGELGTDGSDAVSTRSSTSSSSDSRSSVPRDIDPLGRRSKSPSPFSAAKSDKDIEARELKSDLSKLKRKGSKDKEKKEAKSKSKFYTSDDNDRESVISHGSSKSRSGSKFYVTSERVETVEEVKGNQKVSSRTVSHHKSTVCATKSLFEKHSLNVSHQFEDLTPKHGDNRAIKGDKTSPPKPKIPTIAPKRVFGKQGYTNNIPANSQLKTVDKTGSKTEHTFAQKSTSFDHSVSHSKVDSSTKSGHKPAHKSSSFDHTILTDTYIDAKSAKAITNHPPSVQSKVGLKPTKEQTGDQTPVAPVRSKKLARKQSSPGGASQDLQAFIRAESEPPKTGSSITKSVSSHVIGVEKTSEEAGKGNVVKRKETSHRRMKSLLSFTAEDTDIFQRKSTEYLLQDVDMAISPNTPASSDSTSSIPRVSRRDLLTVTQLADKRRSRSLEPMHTPWGMKLSPSKKPTPAPKLPAKPTPPTFKKIAKTPPKPPQKIVSNLATTFADNSEVYCDATSKPLSKETPELVNSEAASKDDITKDSSIHDTHEYDNNFENLSRRGDATKEGKHEQSKRKSMSLPVMSKAPKQAVRTPSDSEQTYEEFDFQSESSAEKADIPSVHDPKACDSVQVQSDNALDNYNLVEPSLDDSVLTLTNGSHRISSSSGSSFGNPQSVEGHIYADIDEVTGRLPSNSDQSENVYEYVDLAEAKKQKQTLQQSRLDYHSDNSDPEVKQTEKRLPVSNLNKHLIKLKQEEDESGFKSGHRPGVSRKLSRKESRKLTRKLSRKWTKKYGQSEKYEKLKQLLQEFEEHSTDPEDEEALEFSDSESEWGDDDSFTDESDLEYEQEILSKLTLEDREALGDYCGTPKLLSKTQKVAMELLSTERNYVGKLHLIDQVFHNRIVIENRELKMFSNDVIPQMFSNVKSIYQFHHDFLLPQLEKRMQEWSSCPRIGDVMCKYAPFLKIYTEYVQNFDTAMHAITNWKDKIPRFHALLLELQELPECEMLTLQHHMLGPIQRVPRYELLLKEYLKHLPLDSADRSETEKALSMVTTAALTSNNIMRSNEKFQKLLEVNEKLGGILDLVSPTRELIKEGRIVKLSARNGMQQERYIFLFNDMFLLCQSVPLTLKQQQYKVSYKLSIEGMQVQEGDNLETPNTFYVKNKQKLLELHCDTEEDKTTWQISLWTVIGDYLKKKQTRGQGHNLQEEFSIGVEPGKTPPKWIKDQEASQCMLCATTFTVLKRRHHCRGCGKVVCGKCSAYKAKLEYDGGEKLNRVCYRCYSYLGQKQGGVQISGPTLVSSPAIRSRRLLQVNSIEGTVRSGYMHMSLDMKVWTKRWFAVHKDYVLYSFKAHQDVVALTSMPLPGYMVQKSDRKDNIMDREHVFKLWHPGQLKAYYFQVDNKDTLEKWLSTLEYMVQAELPPDFTETSSKSQDRESNA